MNFRDWFRRAPAEPSTPLDVLADLDFDPCQSLFCGADATHRCTLTCPDPDPDHDTHTLLLCDRHHDSLVRSYTAAGQQDSVRTETISGGAR